MFQAFYDAFLGLESSHQHINDPVDDKPQPIIFRRSGNVALNQAFLYVNIEGLSRCRLVCNQMKDHVDDYARQVVKYIKKSGSGRPSPYLDDELAKAPIAPLQILSRLLDDRVILCNPREGQHYCIVNISAIERKKIDHSFEVVVKPRSMQEIMGRMLSIDGVVYSFRNDDQKDMQGADTVMIFDPSLLDGGSKTMIQCTVKGGALPFNGRLSRCACVVHDDYVYISGGRIYDAATSSWVCQSNLMCLPVSALKSLADTYRYKKVNINSEIEIPSLRWEKLSSMSNPRYGHDMILWKGLLITGGGLNGSLPVNTIEGYDLKDRTWKNLPSLTIPRYSFNFHVIEGNLFVAGGERNDHGRIEMLTNYRSVDNEDSVDDELCRWETIMELPEHYRPTGAIGGITSSSKKRIYYFGLCQNQAKGVLSTVMEAAATASGAAGAMNRLNARMYADLHSPSENYWDFYDTSTSCFESVTQSPSEDSIRLGLITDWFAGSTDYRKLPLLVKWSAVLSLPGYKL